MGNKRREFWNILYAWSRLESAHWSNAIPVRWRASTADRWGTSTETSAEWNYNLFHWQIPQKQLSVLLTDTTIVRSSMEKYHQMWTTFIFLTKATKKKINCYHISNSLHKRLIAWRCCCHHMRYNIAFISLPSYFIWRIYDSKWEATVWCGWVFSSDRLDQGSLRYP